MKSRDLAVCAVKSRPFWSILLGLTAVAVLVATAFAVRGPSRSGVVPSTAATTYPCSHVGGGVWGETWNNSSGRGPTHVWIPEPGHYWAEYNNSTGVAADPGWGTPGTTLDDTPGWTTVNMTNDSTVAESMMQYDCLGSGPTLPWHFNFATHTFVRDQ